MAAKKYLGWGPGVQADRVCQPPFLRRELDDVLFALRVDDEAAQATVRDEGGVPGHLAAPLEELAGREAAGNEHRPHESEVFRREGRASH